MTRRWLVLLLVGLVATSCGDDGDERDAVSTSVTSTSVATTTGPDSEATTTTDTSPECRADSLEGGTISTVGFDDITFGMTVVEAEAESGVCLRPDRPVNQECYRVVPDPGPDGISFLVTEGTIERVDVFGGSVTTRSGIGLGSSEAEVAEQFGVALEVRPHPQGGGNELVLVPTDEADAEFRVVFETNGETVTRYRSGRRPQVDDPLPCPDGGEAPPPSTTG